eukprot:gb/GFBE01018324.1/.p1 GENE.gb/GFBE01018324.1/~~gb/GFBE01018324.1/.p1  ORF type:complete len:1512 (+),score=383.19 gb/GFBE01018324.1/:1-4536(+)
MASKDKDIDALFGTEDDVQEDTAENLFGDFDSADEQAASESGSRRGKRQHAQMEAAPGPGDGQEAASASSGPRPTKRKKADVSKFFDLEAEEAGGSEDEDEDADMGDLIDDTGAKPASKDRGALRRAMQESSKELEELSRDMASRGPLSGAARLFSDKLGEMEKKYKDIEERAERGEDVMSNRSFHRPAQDKVTHTVTVPEPDDPKLWCVHTFGPEKELCISLMYKAFEAMTKGTPLPIYSVFFSPHLRGYIYIEAFREADVKEFIKGIRGMSQFGGFSLVPTQQMPTVFTASQLDAKKTSLLKAGDWVRMKRGHYGGDLAQVEEVQDEIVTLKLKPRIHYTSDLKRSLKEKGVNKRPLPRWFNKADIEAAQELLINTEVRRTQKGYKHFYVVEGEAYRDGFLYKTFKPGWFIFGEQVRPQEYELQEWRNAPAISENVRPARDLAQSKEEEDREKMPPPAVPTKVPSLDDDASLGLLEGDKVIVISGDLRNLRGIITKALFGSPTVLMRPIGVDGVSGDLSIAARRLSKYFEVGNYVKVVGGDNDGDTGHVTRVDLESDGDQKVWGPNCSARVLTLGCTQEFGVKICDLRLTIERPNPQEEVGEFKIEQLVQVAGRGENRAMIVRLEADSRAVILGQDGERFSVNFAELEPVPMPARAKYKQDAWCIDQKGHKIRPGCVVKAPRTLTGRSAPVRAQVLYIHHGTVFIKATEAMVGEKAYIVCPGEKCEFVWDKDDMPCTKGGGKGIKKKQAVSDKTEEELQMKQISYGVTMASKMSFLRPEWFKQLGLAKKPTDTGGVVFEKGTGVRITGGGYKGLRGEVRDLLDDKVRISLLSKPKLVEVSVNNVEEDDFRAHKWTRWPDAQPKTPHGDVFPVPKGMQETRSEEQQIADAVVGDAATGPSEEDAWDPNWLTQPISDSAKSESDGRASPAVLQAGGSVPASPVVAPEEAAQPPSRTSSTRRRKAPRLPGAAGEVPSPATPQATVDPSLATFEPPAQEEQMSPWTALPAARVTKARPMWLLEGLGVHYTERGLSRCGWIIKVYADMAQVLPAHAMVETPLAMEGNETRPWTCNSRGEMAVIFDGPKRGTKGKVVGIQGSTVFIRSDAGGELVKAEKKDIAMFSSDPKASARAWVAAAEARAAEAAAARSREEDASSVAGSETRKRPISETAEPWEADVLAAAKLGDDTPASEPEELPAETPVSAGERTPMVVVAETPPEVVSGATPFMQGGLPAGAVTPMPGGVTPMLPAGTPMLSSGGLRIGAVTPFPGQGVGGETPHAGGETPNFVKKQEDVPLPGGATPLTPMPGYVPMKEQAPITPAPGFKKAEDTPQDSAAGSQTPAAGGDATPLVAPGAGTPGIVKGAQTPYAAKVEGVEGAQTPLVNPRDGGLTPAAGSHGDEATPDNLKGEQTPLSSASEQAAAAARGKTGGSYYKMVGGVRYDRRLLEQAEEFSKDGQVSIGEARQLWEGANDGRGVTEVERRTLEHIVKELRFTKPALDFLKKKIAEAKKSG